MSKYLVLNGFCVRGGVDVAPGQTIELSEQEARFGLSKNWLTPVDEKPAHPEVGSPDRVAHADPAVTKAEPPVVHRDPETKTAEAPKPRPRPSP